MSSFSNDFKEEVKEKIDIVDVISDYVQLKKSGKNYKGLCPFHQENTPSFTVNPQNQFYHCFGCGAGGDVYSFLMEIEHITFYESLKIAAERVGLELPNQSQKQKRVANLREKIFKMNDLTARFYNYLLLNHKCAEKAFDYLKNRGFNKKDIKKFNLGFAPDKWTALYKFLSNKGYNRKEMAQAGLIVNKSQKKYYDRFRNRIIFPIFNSRGEVLAFGGRILDESVNQPKYLNSPDSIVYDKSDNLYGLNWAKNFMRNKDEVIIMEGYTDVLTAQIKGVKNVVASLGTSLTEKQSQLIKRYAKKAYIAYDADIAGAKATLRGLEILKNKGLNVKVIQLPENADPDDFLKSKGKKEFLNLKDNALSLVEFKINNIISNKNIQDTDDKINLSHEIIDVLVKIKDPIERELYSKKIANKLDIDKERMIGEVEKKYKKLSKKDKRSKKRYTKNAKEYNKTNIVNSINTVEKKIIKAFIDYPKYRNFIKKNLSKKYFFTKNSKKLIKYLYNLNKEKTINDILNQIEDEEIKKLFMKLIVSEKSEIDKAILEGYIKNLIENYQFRYKFYLYKKLQNSDINLATLNSILSNYQELIFNERGDRDG
ncbi:MAG: DNA primase [Bacillota bacterium]